MKRHLDLRLLSVVCMIALVLVSSPVAHASGFLGITSSTTKPLVDAEEFFYFFNFYGAYMGDGHALSIENASEFTKIEDGYLLKSIFNKCEILSLNLNSDASKVMRITCTWANNVPGSKNYLEDFLQLLMETILACGIEADSASSLFESFGKGNAFNVGDSRTMTVDGFKVSYEVTSYAGVSFTIERP